MHQARHKCTTNNDNALGSSNPVLTVHDTQGIILPPPTKNEPNDSEEEEEGTHDEDFSPKRNTTRQATRNV